MRNKTIPWSKFSPKQIDLDKALALHEELVKAAMAVLPNAKADESVVEEFGGYSPGLDILYSVPNIRHTKITCDDRRVVKIETQIPQPVVLGERPPGYGLWLQVEMYNGKEWDLDLCWATSELQSDWYYTESFSVVGLGLVKDMVLAGAKSLVSVLEKAEQAPLVEERWLQVEL
jgi:hypothetical protein